MKNIIYLTITCFASIFAKELPSYFNICHRDDPEINNCVKNNLDELKTHLKTGDANYAIPEIDYLYYETFLDNVKINSNTLYITVSNLILHGCSEYKVQNLKVNFNRSDLKNIVLDGFVGPIIVSGDYKLIGKYLFYNINATGKITGLLDFSVDANIDFEPYEEHDEEYIRVTNVTFGASMHNGNLHFSNIFPKSNSVAKRANAKINSKLQKYMKGINPVLEKDFNQRILGYLNGYLEQFKYDQLLPASELSSDYMNSIIQNM